jgi:hypothetical protein
MNNKEIARQIDLTAKDYRDYLIPSLEKLLNGKIIQVEGLTNTQAEGFDRVAGIDMVLDGSGWAKGIAGRRQPGDNRKSFTIRRSVNNSFNVEYKKKQYAIDNDCLYPTITVQAYMNNYKGVIDFAIANTVDIFKCIKETMYWIPVHSGGEATMFVVWWDEMLRRGMDVKVYRKPYESQTVFILNSRAIA